MKSILGGKQMKTIKLPFYLKLSIIISVLIITIVTGISYTLLTEIKTEYRNQIKTTSSLLATLIVKYSVEPVVMENYTTLYNIIDSVKEDPGSDIMQISILGPDGYIKASTNRLIEGSKLTSNQIENNSSTFVFKKNYLDVLAPITAYDNLWGYLNFRYSLSGLEKLFLSTQYQILLLALIFIAIGLITALFVAKAIVKPINILVKSSQEIAQGDFHNPISIKTRDEFSFLGETLEEMRISLKCFVSGVAKKAISYEGNLKIFALPTLLRLLNNTNHTGGLVLKKENDIGIIYFTKGEITDAYLKTSRGKKAVFDFFTWSEGDFKFSPSIKSREKTINEAFNDLILEAVRQVQDHNIFKQSLPAKDMTIIPAIANVYKLADEINLNSDEEKILNCIQHKSSINDLRKSLTWPNGKIYEIIYRLISLGLVSIESEENLNNYLIEKDMEKIITFPGKKIM
ncbi:DUF4388 domain-containing protein [Halocella sp. SP3-1]|nr:DUF4388 domain-containing protein [Halocella sp. SP3-1]